MICKQEVQINAKICPMCGAMPWKMPESFLNAEQHKIWLEDVYNPQLEHWMRMQEIRQKNYELKSQTKEFHVQIDNLKEKNHALQKQIKALDADIEVLTKENQVMNNEIEELRRQLSDKESQVQPQQKKFNFDMAELLRLAEFEKN